jgi:excinuclease UvrABC nuclease subunit
MEIKVKIPIKADIVFQGLPITTSPAGSATTWSKEQLGDYADRSGVYIHHCDSKILYVGKTTSGHYGTFAERLRREFQEKASSNSALYQLLYSQAKTIKTFLLDLDDLDMMVDSGSIQLTKERKALILEQILIGVFQPEGNKI